MTTEHSGNQLLNSDPYIFQVSQLCILPVSWWHSFHNANWESALCQELLSYCCCWIKLRMLGKAHINTAARLGMDLQQKLPTTPWVGQVCALPHGKEGLWWGPAGEVRWAQVSSAQVGQVSDNECFPTNSMIWLFYQGRSRCLFVGKVMNRENQKA